ncbi:MAG: hypothetical protein WD967_00185, partial [Candidatus Levyibacteriota bacterium]
MKNNRNVFILVAFLVLVLISGGVFLLLNKNGSKQLPVTVEESIPSLDPQEIGLTLEMGADGQRVIMTIKNTEDIESVEYQLSYNSEGDIPRGAIGQVTITNPGQPLRQEIVLGTCSDVCHYDEGISNIKVVVKVIKTDGKV